MAGSGSNIEFEKMMTEHLLCPMCDGKMEFEHSIFWD